MPAKGSVHVAVLECGRALSDIINLYGGWTGIFAKHLSETFDEFVERPKVVATKYDVVVEMYRYPDPEEIDAVMITGSPADPTANDPWIIRLVKFVNMVLDPKYERIRLTGFCFGHQIIARALGYEIRLVPGGIQSGVRKAFLTEFGRELLETDRESILVPAMHKWAVFADGESSDQEDEVKILAWTEAGFLEGLCLPGKMLTMQGHPEFECCVLDNVIVWAWKTKLISGDQARDDLESLTLAKRHKQVMSTGLVWQAIARLFVQP